MKTKLIIFVIIICISVSGCIVGDPIGDAIEDKIEDTSFAYDVTVSPVNGTAIIYIPIALDEDGSVSEVMDNLTIQPLTNSVLNSTPSYEFIDTIHGKALEIITDEPIMIKNSISQRGRHDLNITMWNKTFEKSTGSIWMYVDSSSTAEDIIIRFDVRYVQSVLPYGNGVSITTNRFIDTVTPLKTGWNTYSVYKHKWG